MLTVNDQAEKFLRRALDPASAPNEREVAARMFWRTAGDAVGPTSLRNPLTWVVENMKRREGELRSMVDDLHAQLDAARKDALKSRQAEIEARREADAHHSKRFSQERKASTPAKRARGTYPGATSLDPHVALFGAVTDEWRTIGEIHRSARKNGFTGSISGIRKRAADLTYRGIIEGRNINPREWRLKPSK